MKESLLLLCLLFTVSLFSQSKLGGIIHYESGYSQKNVDNYFKYKRKTIKDKKMLKLSDNMFLKSKKIRSTLLFTLKEAIYTVDKKISIKDRVDIVEKISSMTAGGPEPYHTSSITKNIRKTRL